jgi:hypothetical protein
LRLSPLDQYCVAPVSHRCRQTAVTALLAWDTPLATLDSESVIVAAPHYRIVIQPRFTPHHTQCTPRGRLLNLASWKRAAKNSEINPLILLCPTRTTHRTTRPATDPREVWVSCDRCLFIRLYGCSRHCQGPTRSPRRLLTLMLSISLLCLPSGWLWVDAAVLNFTE